MLFLPYWLLTYEEMLSLMLDRSDNNAPNQAMMFSSAVIEGKKDFLRNADMAEMEANITLDSPIPYNLEDLLSSLKDKDTEMVPGGYFAKMVHAPAESGPLCRGKWSSVSRGWSTDCNCITIQETGRTGQL